MPHGEEIAYHLRSNDPLIQKIKWASNRYQKRNNQKPNYCFVHALWVDNMDPVDQAALDKWLHAENLLLLTTRGFSRHTIVVGFVRGKKPEQPSI